MRYAYIVVAFAAALLLFGCTQQPSTGANGSFDKNFGFGPYSNNTTSTTGELNTVLTRHAYTVNYTGNWTDAIANVTLQGSLNNVDWYNISSISGNTNTYTAFSDDPLMYVRFKVLDWNASTNSSIASLSISYSGTNVDPNYVDLGVRVDTINSTVVALLASNTTTNLLFANFWNKTYTYNTTQVDTLLGNYWNKTLSYNATQVDALLANYWNKTLSYNATQIDTLFGSYYNKTNSYNKTEVDLAVGAKRDLTNMTFYNSTASFPNLTGVGNMYVCVDENGTVYRNATCS